jgi:hypothetical protein
LIIESQDCKATSVDWLISTKQNKECKQLECTTSLKDVETKKNAHSP